MTTWHQTRDQATQAFGGETPNNTTEELCIAAFEESPAWFISTLEQVEHDYANGSIRSGWGILRKRITDNNALRNPEVDATPDRAKLIHLAERWITNAGLYVPTETEVEDAMFGPHGSLRDYAHDNRLRERLVVLWQESRNRADQARADMLQCAARYRQQHAETDT